MKLRLIKALFVNCLSEALTPFGVGLADMLETYTQTYVLTKSSLISVALKQSQRMQGCSFDLFSISRWHFVFQGLAIIHFVGQIGFRFVLVVY